MKTKLNEKKRNILRKVYGILSLSTALFVFQACYGTPADQKIDITIQGTVKSKATNLPIEGIYVSVANQSLHNFTNNTGKYTLYLPQASSYKIKFQDVDTSHNGWFIDKDTIVDNVSQSLTLNVSLDVK
jgi:hypothetical protein